MSTTPGQYRLLYVQPDVDRGDRVCIGLLFHEGAKNAAVLYDPEFSKLRCVAPTFDRELLRFYLSDFQSSLDRTGDLDVVLRRYGPQISASLDRSVVSPVTDRVKQILLERFAMSGSIDDRLVVAGVGAGSAASLREETREHIARFTRTISTPLHLDVIANARPADILGRSIRKIEPVAAAVKIADSIVLVDGIDLRVATPRKGIGLAGRVAHTFWQYGRLRAEDLTAGRVKRVGVVMNGAIPTSRRAAEAYSDAHDYALDQFRQEADLAVDAASASDTARFRDLLAGR